MNETRAAEVELGRQVRALRLRLDLNQQQVADRAGIALNAVKNLERGGGATLHSLTQTLRVLGRIEWLTTLAPAVTISPIQMLRSRTPRRRASRRPRAAGVSGQGD